MCVHVDELMALMLDCRARGDEDRSFASTLLSLNTVFICLSTSLELERVASSEERRPQRTLRVSRVLRENLSFMQIRVLPSIFVMPSDSDMSLLKNGCRVAERLCLRTLNGQNKDIFPISCGVTSESRFSRDQAGKPHIPVDQTHISYKASYTLSERCTEPL